MAIEVFAPAKVNLTLHVTGLRADGYHLLDSLAVFAPVGDALRIRDADRWSLDVEGPEAGTIPSGAENLVMQAGALLAEGRAAAITLTKSLPVASGIGGGSADAAAALRGLAALWDGLSLDQIALQIADLGADIPMCLACEPVRARGVGDWLDPVIGLPPLPAVLVNPRVPVATRDVFNALPHKDNPAMPEQMPRFAGLEDCVAWLAQQRNDLQAPAITCSPVIGSVLEALAQPDCLLARMSGSGATCFGLYPDMAAARRASARIARAHPNWWIACGELGDQSGPSRAVIS